MPNLSRCRHWISERFSLWFLAKPGRLAGERCFLGLYRRARANVASLLALRQIEDFRALARITRSLFEFTVELKLLDIVPDAFQKITTFSRLERLRSARKIVAFNASLEPSPTAPNLHERFVEEQGETIVIESRRLWSDGDSVEHWTGMTLKEAVSLLKRPSLAVLEVSFPQLLWQTNSDDMLGWSLTSASYQALAIEHIQLAVEFYGLLLESMIEKFQLQSSLGTND